MHRGLATQRHRGSVGACPGCDAKRHGRISMQVPPWAHTLPARAQRRHGGVLAHIAAPGTTADDTAGEQLGEEDDQHAHVLSTDPDPVSSSSSSCLLPLVSPHTR